jgi:hypothetical protein
VIVATKQKNKTMTEQEMKINASIAQMLLTHEINIVFTPKQSVVDNANTNAPASIITEERVLELIREHTATASDALKETIEEAIEEHDFSDAVESAVDDAISGKDWEYELQDSLDYDKIADKVADKIDWSDVISNNDIITTDSLDIDDIMLKSDTLSDDEKISRGDLGDEVIAQLQRDWFKTMLNDEIKSYVLEKQLPLLVAKAIHTLFVNASHMAIETKKTDETSDLQQR